MSDPLAGGVFDAPSNANDFADLRQLVDDISAKSFNTRIGARGLPETFDAALWSDLAESGLTDLMSSPDLDAGPAEMAVVLRGVARRSGAVPIAENDLLARWLARRAHLKAPDGPLTVAIATTDPSEGAIEVTAADVPWARSATAVVLAVRRSDDLLVGIAERSATRIAERHNLAGEPRDTVTVPVDTAQMTALDVDDEAALLRRGAWARCVQIVGALDAAAELSVSHTREREQFGRPLAKFQSVQHALAQMAGEIERMRAVTTAAVAAATECGFDSEHTDFATSIAKVVGSQVVPTATAIAHQLHGAIGTTIEHPLWLATTRAQSWIDEFGGRADHASRLARRLSIVDDPWDVIVGAATR